MAPKQPIKTAPKVQPDVVIEIIETADKGASGLDDVNKLVKVISASEAFRKYSWLKSAPILNSVGDLRGMVISAQWRTVYQVSSKVGSALGDVTVIAGLAANLAQARSEIKGILNSKNPPEIKTAQLSAQVSAIIFRTLGGVVPAGFGILATSVQGYCRLAGLASGGRFNPQACISNLDAASLSVNTTFKSITDGNNIYSFINAKVSP